MDDPEASRHPRQRRRRRAHWIGVAAAALALLVLSQVLWWWETWPVRQMLDTPTPPVQAGVRG